MSEADEKEKLKEKFLDALWNDYRYSVSKIDEQSLLISSGALGISLTFVKDIVPLKDSVYIGIYYSALFCFACTIILGFLNHNLSARSIKRRYEDLNDVDYSKPGAVAKQSISSWVGRINAVTSISLVLGLFFLLSYCTINISHYRNKSDKLITNKNCHE